MEPTPLLVVCGPTASGKTGLAAGLAERLNGEVIGADSMQIYKGFDIASAMPSKEERRGVPHHMQGFLEPDSAFSVADYTRLAKAVIQEVAGRGKLPVLCGGTGLYINSLIDNIRFENIETDGKIRERLRLLAKEKGAAHLHEMLRKADPALAEKLHPNNLGRVIRALEVFEATGERMSDLQKRARSGESEYNLCMTGLAFRDRKRLYGRINKRVDDMLERGLLREAATSLKNPEMKTAAQAIGLKEFERYFSGEEKLCEAVEKLKQSTRRYAKRQLTWFNRDRRIVWFYVDDYKSGAELTDAVLKHIGDVQWQGSRKK